MKHLEDAEQMAVMSWAQRITLPNGVNLSEAMYSVRNESAEKGTKAKIAARIARAKRMGYKPGQPDLVLPYAAGGYSALYIEMKKPNIKGQQKGRVSEKQKERMDILTQCGNKCVVCFGAEQAIEAIKDYLDIQTIKKAPE